MPRQIRLFGLSAVLFIFAQSPPVFAQDVQVRSQNGLFSIKASNASATQLADALSDQLGISVVVTGDTEALVNIDIVEEPLDKALTKISPNNMLVRAGKAADSEIVEVVLLMGEGSQIDSSTEGADQFLPSGSPAEEIAEVDDDSAGQTNGEQSTDSAVLRDPNRAQMVRDAAAAASSDVGVTENPAEGMPAAQQPVEYSSDVLIDPDTGLPLQQQ